KIIVTRATKTHDWAVGLSQNDGTCLFDTLCKGTIKISSIIAHGTDAAESTDPARFKIEEILHRDRHTVQRFQRSPIHKRTLSISGFRARFVESMVHKRVQTRVACFNPRYKGTNDIDWRQFTPANAEYNLL